MAFPQGSLCQIIGQKSETDSSRFSQKHAAMQGQGWAELPRSMAASAVLGIPSNKPALFRARLLHGISSSSETAKFTLGCAYDVPGTGNLHRASKG